MSKKISNIDIYQITNVNVEEQTYTIKQLNFNKVFENVEIIGQGLGHGRGQLTILNENDLVLVGFIVNSYTPYILGSIFNNFIPEQDYKIPIEQNEWLVIAQSNGAYIYIKNDNSIKLKNNNGVIVLNADGTITMNNYTFPIADGSSGQVLKTDGNGTLTWQNDTDT